MLRVLTPDAGIRLAPANLIQLSKEGPDQHAFCMHEGRIYYSDARFAPPGQGTEPVAVLRRRKARRCFCSTRGQNRKHDLLYLACDLNGFTLILGQHLGGVAGIANLNAKRS